jgi:hypothetical protein
MLVPTPPCHVSILATIAKEPKGRSYRQHVTRLVVPWPFVLRLSFQVPLPPPPQLRHNLLAVRIALLPSHVRFGVFGLQFWANFRSLGSHFGDIHLALPRTVPLTRLVPIRLFDAD